MWNSPTSNANTQKFTPNQQETVTTLDSTLRSQPFRSTLHLSKLFVDVVIAHSELQSKLSGCDSLLAPWPLLKLMCQLRALPSLPGVPPLPPPTNLFSSHSRYVCCDVINAAMLSYECCRFHSFITRALSLSRRNLLFSNIQT